jgi:hypothetical protein
MSRQELARWIGLECGERAWVIRASGATADEISNLCVAMR